MTLSQFLCILRARWKLSAAVFSVTVLTSVVVSLVLPKKYTAAASVVVDIKPDPISGIALGGMMNPAIMATQVDILNSDRVARRVIQNLKLDQNPQVRAQWLAATNGQGSVGDWLSGAFQKSLDVKPSRESNVITVGYIAPDPEFAAALANAFVQAYIDTAIELKVQPAKQYSAFFDQQAKDARTTLEAAQTRLSEYQQAKGIVGSDERLDVETARLNDLSAQLVQLQAIAAESNSRNAQAAGQSDRLAEALANPVVANLRVSLSQAEANLQELNTRLGANNPQVVQARANIAELRAKLDVETKRVAGSVGVTANINASRVAQVKVELDAQRDKVLKLKAGRDDMAVLQRDVDNAQKAYDAIAARQAQTSLESQSQQANVNLLSPATAPLKPSSPKLLLNTLAAIFLGGLLAVGSALVRELMDRRVRGPQDLVEALGLPILGVMPQPAIAGKRGAKPSLMASRIISGRLPGPKKD